MLGSLKGKEGEVEGSELKSESEIDRGCVSGSCKILKLIRTLASSNNFFQAPAPANNFFILGFRFH